MAEEYLAIQFSKCKVIQPYCIAPWDQKLLVYIPIDAETSRTEAKLQQGLNAVLSTFGKQGVLGAGGAIYSHLIPNMTEASLNTFSVTVSSQKNSNTYATDLFAVSHSLKLMATACKDVSVQVYTHNKSVLQSIQKPRQQSGQELLREIYQTTQLLYKNRCTVELFWIPAANPFLGSKSAKTAAKTATLGTSPQSQKEITRRTTLLSAALKTFAGKKPPLPPLVGKFTQSIDCALPGKHTRLLYDSFSKPQAALLAQLRTGKSRLNDYLAKINAVESDQCGCGTGRENVRHFLFHCTQWATYRADLINKTAGRWGDLSLFLGGRSQTRNRDGSRALDEEPWTPNIDLVRATIKFSQLTKRLNQSETTPQPE